MDTVGIVLPITKMKASKEEYNMRVGTIGTSFITEYILENMAKTEGIACEAICSRTEEKARALADKFGVGKIYTDLDAMCADSEIDFIYVASPNSMHYAHVKKALNAGKHVLCEKPFVPTAAQARELAELAKRKHLLLFEANTTFYHPHYAWIREHLRDVGQLQMISATFCQYSSRYDLLKAGQMPNIFNPAFAGGTLMDINVYNISFVAGLLGRPDQVQYFAGKYENGIDTHGVLILRYGNVICQCTGAKNTWCENNVQIMGDKGYLHIGPMSSNCQKIRLVRKGQEDTVLELPENQWFYEIQALAELGNRKSYDICYRNLETSLIVVEILEKARQSAGIPFCE